MQRPVRARSPSVTRARRSPPRIASHRTAQHRTEQPPPPPPPAAGSAARGRRAVFPRTEWMQATPLLFFAPLFLFSLTSRTCDRTIPAWKREIKTGQTGMEWRDHPRNASAFCLSSADSSIFFYSFFSPSRNNSATRSAALSLSTTKLSFRLLSISRRLSNCTRCAFA